MSGSRLAFRVNGRHVVIPEAEGTIPLLHVLRERLCLRGVRFGCGASACGACTILVQGEPTISCELPADAVAGKEVTTIEGFDAYPGGSAIVAAFLEEQAGQCGYCLPGILAKAMPLLASPSQPSRAEIAAALADNLCRCGAHNRIFRAVALAWRLHRDGAAIP